MRALAAVLVTASAALSLLLSRTASAQGYTFVMAGPLASFGHHVNGPASSGGGIEVTANYSPSGRCLRGFAPCDVAFGGVAQAQYLGDRSRFMLGAQGGSILGAELGLAVETAASPYASTLSLHVAPYVSIGVASVGVRCGLPITTLSAGTPFALDIAVALTLKYPVSALFDR